MKQTRLLALTLGILVAASFAAGAKQAGVATGRFDAEIARFDEADRLTPPPASPIVFTGSSSIRRWQSLERDFPGLPVINRGFGGSMVEDAIFYLDRIILRYKPRLVVIYSGDNDLDDGKTPTQVAADYATFVSKIHHALPATRIAIISVRPSIAREALMGEQQMTNILLRKLVANDKLLSYIDLFDALLGANGRPNPAYLVDDGLHPSPAGYEIWKKAIEPVLRAGSN